MSFITFFFAELRFRIKGFLLAVAVCLLAVASVVFFHHISRSVERSIQMITKEMGQNIIILNEKTDAADYYSATGKETLLDETEAVALSQHPEIGSTYYVALLQKREAFQGMDVIVTGAGSVKGKTQGNRKEKRENPFPSIQSGKLYLGYEVARKTNLKTGDRTQLFGKEFTVAGIMEEKGFLDDIRVYMNLPEYQQLAGQAGKITSLLALECLCGSEPLSVQEERMDSLIRALLPGAKVITLRNIAIARYEARRVTEKYTFIIQGILLLCALVFIFALTYSESVKKERETALLAALGFGPYTSIRMHALKAFAIFIPAIGFGFLLGSVLAIRMVPGFGGANVPLDFAFFCPVLLGTALLLALGFSPALWYGLRTDPAEVLREE